MQTTRLWSPAIMTVIADRHHQSVSMMEVGPGRSCYGSIDELKKVVMYAVKYSSPDMQE